MAVVVGEENLVRLNVYYDSLIGNVIWSCQTHRKQFESYFPTFVSKMLSQKMFNKQNVGRFFHIFLRSEMFGVTTTYRLLFYIHCIKHTLS